MLHQSSQEFVFLGRQLYLAITNLDDAPHQVDRKVACPEYWALPVHLQLMAQCHSDAREKLIHSERLGYVVVRTKIQCHDLARLFTATREHHDWDAFIPRPNL